MVAEVFVKEETRWNGVCKERIMIKQIHKNGYIFQIDSERPFVRFKGLFGSPKKAKAPPPTAPAPTPVELDEEVRQKDRDRRRQRIAAAGRGGTILTAGEPLGGRATILGRATA